MEEASEGQWISWVKRQAKLRAKKDETMNKASEAGQQGMQQTTGFVQQTGDQMRNIAQGAAGAMKNAVGIGGSDATTRP
ncbi:hypothetical protein OPV22_017730 [Ensete ventricosum]|uniref:CsbD-like domain-containing protein n=1 Tax=Ensete ventricosum TaxID=4639 RepID=A0AAV8PFJ4_ENSVE|nr:hypothetical protein OPV22_017730 [Ensete ventricosum]